jgi:hypothetical protein
MKNIPTYNATISSEFDGITVISLVDRPAVESNFVAFKDEKPLYQFADEEQHNIIGCIMRADFPIYRINPTMGEFYITYSRETIKQMTLKMISDGTYKNISLMHNGKLIEGVQLQELFIKDSEKGINPSGFEEVKDGSLFAIYHITDDELWQAIKEGIFQGFSLEGYFDTELIKNQKQNKSMLEKIKEKLRSLLQEFGQVDTEEGVVLVYEGDELAEGLEVADVEGNAVADGDYHFENKTVTVADSKVVKIEEKVEEETKEKVVEEQVEEVKAEEQVKEDVVDETSTVEEVKVEDKPSENVEALKSELDSVKAELETVKKELEEIKSVLNKPVAPSVPEQFSAIEDNKPKDWFTAALMKRNK